ncbi:MAG TPA: hypothetical protein VLG49_02930 [Rhabdochlamydiaceae bacterium]|nr:hypothetical protein [Rhabdochlamydiaceae bacterium]
MSGNMRLRHVPSDPLEPHLASLNRVLGDGVCKALPRTLRSPVVQFCFAI